MEAQTIMQMNDILIQTTNKGSISLIADLNSSIRAPLFMLLLCFSLWSCSTDQAPKKSTVASSEASATQDQPTTNSNKKTILFFGDSLTAGYGLDEEQSFPSGGLKRIDWVMRQPADIFFLELGANDMLRGLPIEETRNNLSEIITKVKAKNPQVKIGLCEMMAAPNMGADYVRDFNKLFHDLAKEHQITLVPFYLDGVAGHPELLLPDGKHPNADGQMIAAKNIWKTLESML